MTTTMRYTLKVIKITAGRSVETVYESDAETKLAGYEKALPIRDDYIAKGYTGKVMYGSGWEMSQGNCTVLIFVSGK